MANQLGMDKSLTIETLRQNGMSQQGIADALGVSRGAVIRHLAANSSNSTQAPTGFDCAESTPATLSTIAPVSRSRCEPYRDVILAKLELGLDCQRIHQDLVSEHGFQDKYWSVHRFVQQLGKNQPLPFRRLEVEPGWEMQVDFGAGRPCKDHTGTMRKTHVFRAVLSHSRKGFAK